MLTIKKRTWEIVVFDRWKIENAITKACEATWEIDRLFVIHVAEAVTQEVVQSFVDRIAWVEDVQDLVEKNLIKFGKFNVAKEYIIYRQRHMVIRSEQQEQLEKAFEQNKLNVIKSDGRSEIFDIEKIRLFFDKVAVGYESECNFEEFRESIKRNIVNNIKTSDLCKLLTKGAIDLISIENIAWQFIAWRFYVSFLYKEACKNRQISQIEIYSPKAFLSLFEDYMDSGLYYKDFYKYYSKDDILELWKSLNLKRDFDYNYTQVLMFNKRYLLNPNKVVKELPQEMYMVVAMFLAIPERQEERLKVALQIYEYSSSQMISLPTPTLLNARTNFCQLSSCFKVSLDDDLRGIYHGIENMAQISKFGGWVWVYTGNIRSKWSSIRGVKWASWGVIPWIKVINDTALAVNQLWSRAWAISITIDVWHRDVYNFLDMQTETWDIRGKAFNIFPAISIPDIFMRRVEEDKEWTLFDPLEVSQLLGKNLQDFYGAEFEELYEALERNSKVELKTVVKAKELFKTFLKVTVETWMPYVFFRDTVNRLNPNKHKWMIYSSQLCTEICQNMSASKYEEEKLEDWKVIISYKPGDLVVCNLASINLAKVNKSEEIEAVMPIVARILDNVVTLNFYPIKESEITAKKYRSVWLWYLWLAEYLAVNLLKYDSKEARDKADKILEKCALEFLKASNLLAKERGAYELFEGSDWQKGLIFGRDRSWYLDHSQNSQSWSKLIDDIKASWLRFAYHLAPAPNTSTASVVWTTAALLPIYKKYFVETNSIAPSVVVAPKLNKQNFWMYKEYVSMDMNDVIDMIAVIYKWVDQSISFEWMIDPSRITPAQLFSYYFKAWKQGIKTVYYVRSLSWEVKWDCISCSG